MVYVAQAGLLAQECLALGLAAAPPGTGPAALRNRALVTVAYDTLCRRSELVALERTDLEASPAGDGTVTVRRSKTDQEGTGATRYFAPDTMRKVAAWLQAAGIPRARCSVPYARPARSAAASTPATWSHFQETGHGCRLTPEEAAGVFGRLSRVGAAQNMMRYRVELPAVMQLGGWRTPEMVTRYTRRLDARCSGSAKLAMLQNRE